MSELGKPRNMSPFPKVTRVEVVDLGERVYTQWNVQDVEVHLQDEGRTMKIFLRSD